MIVIILRHRRFKIYESNINSSRIHTFTNEIHVEFSYMALLRFKTTKWPEHSTHNQHNAICRTQRDLKRTFSHQMAGAVRQSRLKFKLTAKQKSPLPKRACPSVHELTLLVVVVVVVVEHKIVFWFTLQLLSGTFLILRRIQRDIVININMFSCKVPVILVGF